jgi:hypothetical protein
VKSKVGSAVPTSTRLADKQRLTRDIESTTSTPSAFNRSRNPSHLHPVFLITCQLWGQQYVPCFPQNHRSTLKISYYPQSTPSNSFDDARLLSWQISPSHTLLPLLSQEFIEGCPGFRVGSGRARKAIPTRNHLQEEGVGKAHTRCCFASELVGGEGSPAGQKVDFESCKCPE